MGIVKVLTSCGQVQQGHINHTVLVQPGWRAGDHQSCSVASPPQLGRGVKKIPWKARGSRWGQGDHSSVTVMGKTGSTWGN